MKRALLTLVLCGCAAPETQMIHWTGAPPYPRLDGRVAITFVVSKRPGDRGGSDLGNIGNTRSEWGIPYAVRANDPQWVGIPEAIDVSLRRFVGETLQAAGIGVVAPTDPSATSQLAVEINDFFADGYQGPFGAGEYRGRIALTIVVLDPATRQPRTRFDVSGEGTTRAPRNAECNAVGGGIRRGLAGEQFCNIFLQALATIQQQLMQRLADPMLRAALLGAPPPG